MVARVPPPERDLTCYVVGTVVDEGTGDPLRGARVRVDPLVDADGGGRRRSNWGRTDGEGRFVDDGYFPATQSNSPISCPATNLIMDPQPDMWQQPGALFLADGVPGHPILYGANIQDLGQSV